MKSENHGVADPQEINPIRFSKRPNQNNDSIQKSPDTVAAIR
jgi:hypothetical protein